MIQESLFTREEWDGLVAKVASEMREFLGPYRTPVFRDRGDHGEGWGTGSYIRLRDSIFILTNEHVAQPRKAGEQLGHQLLNNESLFRVVGHQREFGRPLDFALLPVDQTVWTSQSHSSRAIEIDQIALAHAPVPTELLTFTGFSGENTDFYFNTLFVRGSCHTAREVELPPDDKRFSSRFHFGLDYHPDKATELDKRGLPTPPGLSGSAVWNTGFVEAKRNGEVWSPEMARVTGVIWGWPSSIGCLVATRSEYSVAFSWLRPRAKRRCPTLGAM